MVALNSLELDAESVDARVNQAMDDSTRVWVPQGCQSGGSIEQVRAAFKAERVWPRPGVVEVEKAHAPHLGIPPGDYQVWFIARAQDQVVFFEEHSERFGVGWGPEADSGKIADLGVRTDDPIDAFLA